MVRRALMVVVAILLLSLVGCGQGGASSKGPQGQPSPADGGQPSAQVKDPVKIGVTMPLSGNVAFDGQNTVKGMQAAADVLNKNGGILGHPVKLVALDDKANPEEGVNATKRLMSSEKVNALATALNSSVGLAQIDVTNGQMLHVVVLASSPDITDKGYPNVFRVATTSAAKEAPLIEHMKSKVKKVAMMATNDDYGRGLVAMYEKAWANGGPEIVSKNFFQLTETNYVPFLTKIRAENPDGLYIAAQAVQFTTVLKQAAQISLKPKIIWGAGATITPTSLKLGGDLVNGVIASDNYVESNPSPENQTFVKAFNAIAPELKPSYYESTGYDAVMVIAKGMTDAGTIDDWQKIAEAMHKLSYTGPRGTLTFDQKGQVKLDAFLVQARDGKEESLK